MVTCQVFKNVELTKFLEVEGVNLELEEELSCDIYRNHYEEDRKFSASIRLFTIREGSDSEEETECVVQAVAPTPNEAIQILARMIEGESRRVFKCELNEITKENIKGSELIVPPLKHTPCDVVNEEIHYRYFDCENEVLREIDYNKYK